jgi:hypothetical protein
MDLRPIEESACYRRLRDPRIVDSEPFRFAADDGNKIFSPTAVGPDIRERPDDHYSVYRTASAGGRREARHAGPRVTSSTAR